MFKCSILSSRSLQVQVWVSYFRSTGSKDRHRKTRGLMCFDHNAQNRSSRGFNVEFFAGLFQVSYLRNVNHSSNIVETATRTGLKELGFPRPFRVSCLSRAPIRVLTVCHGDWNSDRPGKKKLGLIHVCWRIIPEISQADEKSGFQGSTNVLRCRPCICWWGCVFSSERNSALMRFVNHHRL